MLVDGSFFLHSAFHAMYGQNLTNPKGEPSGAIYGFVNQLNRLQQVHRPSHFAVMLDTPGQSERRKIWPTYKDNRGDTPDDLILQMKKVPEACYALGIPVQGVAGYEADDLIAAYAREASREDCDVKIVSVDKDLFQLASPKVKILTDVSQESWMDAEGLYEKWGVTPEQMGDLLALSGDSVDNIPGVPGIGYKRAADLLQKYGTLRGVFAAARKGARALGVPGVGPKLTKNLVQSEDMALQMRRIVELLPVEGLDASDWRTRFRVPSRDPVWMQRAEAFLEKEGMTSLLSRLQMTVSARAALPAPPSPGLVTVEDEEGAKKAMQVLASSCEGEDRLFFVAAAEAGAGFSVYGGPDLDFGGGPRLYVDLSEGRKGALLPAFGAFFAEARFRKVYHCFSETWRALGGLRAAPHEGLAADVLHMARLENPGQVNFELEKLGARYAPGFSAIKERHRRGLVLAKAGKEAKAEERAQHVASGAHALHDLYSVLRVCLKRKAWRLEGPQGTPEDLAGLTMWDFYLRVWRPLGRLLWEIECAGMPVCPAKLAELERDAEAAMERHGRAFTGWAKARIAADLGGEAAEAARPELINLNSTVQLKHLLFGEKGAVRKVDSGLVQEQEVPREAPVVSSREELSGCKVKELKAMLRQAGKAVKGKKAELVERLLDDSPAALQKPRLKKVAMALPGLGLEPPAGFVTKQMKQPQVSMEAMAALAEQRAEELGAEGQRAVAELIKHQEVEAVVSGFLRPLKGYVTDQNRVHAFLNLNTETGRLSSRQPNLLGEPLGKAVPLREAFAARPGQLLIVADYGQLELRVCAHLADSTPMVELLKAGGDIHSRTAQLMFKEVAGAVERGEVEVDGSGPGTVKEEFPEERRRAKVLNFSVLYGKTAFTLAKEWGVQPKEAEALIEKWYAAFPEISVWKRRMEEEAKSAGARTLLGRDRPVWGRPSSRNAWQAEKYAQRQASNSPVQGGAADIVVSAMLKLRESELLNRLGYRQILQVHDEVILEGPAEHADEALAEVVRVMEDPLDFALRVPLVVDARHAATWHQAKA